MNRAEFVDPMTGTVGDEQAESFHGGGKTHPGACLPGGMVQLSPDTVTGGDNGTGYNFCHSSIEGFSFNHMSGIGWYGDLGNIQVMPVVGETDLRSGSNAEVTFKKGKEGWKSPFSHDKEWAKAGRYSVFLERYAITANATVTEHTGLLKFEYPTNSDARVIFNFSRRIGGKADFEHIDIINDRRLEGSIKCTPAGGGFGRGSGRISYNLYFVCEFSESAKNMRFFADEEFASTDLRSFDNEDAGLVAEFGNLADPLEIKCAISYNDLEGARENFDAECRNISFEEAAEAACRKWEEELGVIEVSGSDETDLKIFYTCLYHTLLDPRTAADVNGRYTVGGKFFQNTDYRHRTLFSGWDVYRSEFPLLSIMRPDIVNDEINSLLRIAEVKNTSFPQWELMGIDSHSMVGDPGLIVVADAYIKGVKPYDEEKAYEIAKASSLSLKELFGKPFSSVRPDCRQYLDGAYVPEKLSDTLEFLLADFTMAKFAAAMGKTDDAKFFSHRVKRWSENYNPVLRFMAPRHKSGRFVFEWGRYGDNGTVESNIFQQSWFVPYDVAGLSEKFGKKRTVRLLEKFFAKAKLSALWNNDYNHSNEPCHNITHYFNMLGLPHRTQYWTRRVQKEAYRLGAFGFCGNEDVGQLSAWYVLSAIGFAQLCPGYQAYYINTPLFKKAVVKLDRKYHSCEQGETFTVECDKDPLAYPYVAAMHLNGKEITRPYLTYSEITAGGVLKFTLSENPSGKFEDYIPEKFI